MFRIQETYFLQPRVYSWRAFHPNPVFHKRISSQAIPHVVLDAYRIQHFRNLRDKERVVETPFNSRVFVKAVPVLVSKVDSKIRVGQSLQKLVWKPLFQSLRKLLDLKLVAIGNPSSLALKAATLVE